MDFTPEFDQNVYVLNPDGSKNQVNPEYCATPLCAYQLALVMWEAGHPCTVTPGPALGEWGSTFGGNFTITQNVPWLQFEKDGQIGRERAGSLAAFWMRATNQDTGIIDQKTALRNALADVEGLFA